MKANDDVRTLKGIGEKKAALLNSHGIFTLEDILGRAPRKYEDRRFVTPVSELDTGKDRLIRVKVTSRRYSGFRYKKKSPLLLLTEDDTGSVEIVFFNGAYLANLFNVGSYYTFFGKVSMNNGRVQMIHPEFHRDGDPQDIRGIIPVYPEIEGISQNEYRKLVLLCSDVIGETKDWLTDSFRAKYNLAGMDFALKNIHFPENEKQILQSRYRFVFDELLVLEAGLISMRKVTRDQSGVKIDPSYSSEFMERLPFKLTQGQTECWSDISGDLFSEKPMNRLIQGDVGSGKTVIAELAMYSAARSGYQSVMMAPTEILAKQHYATITKDFDGTGIKIDLLTGETGAAEKRALLERLENGETDIVIGTHALIEPGVKFRSIGLAVTDEQHRFGVNQRHLLSEKGEGVNIMVMTATPIPRTLAVILYGDLDVSQIRTMPEGRKPVVTKVAHPEDRMAMYGFIKKKLDAGEQAYVVAPLIEDSDKIDAVSCQELYEELKGIFKDSRLELLNGAMDEDTKNEIMERFYEGSIDMLVSTVVIEIGINVPNATVMVIENSERFGLAQMHQLRGRVGRGTKKSYCFLVLSKETELAVERARIMCESSDGFVIAEEDLRLRGPGEIFGTRQHGLPELDVSDLVKHQDVLIKAKDAASAIVEDDPGLKKRKNSKLRKRVIKMFGKDIRLEL